MQRKPDYGTRAYLQDGVELSDEGYDPNLIPAPDPQTQPGNLPYYLQAPLDQQLAAGGLPQTPGGEAPPAPPPEGTSAYVPDQSAMSTQTLDPSAPSFSAGTQDSTAYLGFPQMNSAPQMKAPAAVDPSGYFGGIGRLEQKYASYPQMNKPKWWERAIAGGIGGLAGWSNAASRTRNPIDIPAMSQAILHPGYADKVAQWQSQAMPLEKQAELEGQKFATQQAVAKDQATLDHLRAQSDYYRGLGRTQVAVTPGMEKLTNGVLKAGTMVPASLVSDAMKDAAGRYANRRVNMTPAEKYAELHKSFPNMNETDLRQAVINPNQFGKPEKTPAGEFAMYYEAAGGDSKKALDAWQRDKIKIARESRAPRDPDIADIRHENADRASREEDARMETAKLTRENSIQARRTAEINSHSAANHVGPQMTMPDPKNSSNQILTPEGARVMQDINKKYAQELQANEDAYHRQIRAKYGPDAAIDFDVDPGTLEYRPRATAPRKPMADGGVAPRAMADGGVVPRNPYR